MLKDPRHYLVRGILLLIGGPLIILAAIFLPSMFEVLDILAIIIMAWITGLSMIAYGVFMIIVYRRQLDLAKQQQNNKNK
ncbi:MAG TPA: hypothetical protein GX698_04220 [Acholeplasmataceae bacterium]|nr:hypothetical protein [Acholeplasmataceae bacterium]